jgi:hypothetical protein
MELEKMKKEELLLLVQSLEAQVEQQKHLAQAIDYKDQELIKQKTFIQELQKQNLDLNKQINNINQSLNNANASLNQHKELPTQLVKKDQELIDVKNVRDVLEKQLKESQAKYDLLEKGAKQLEAEHKKVLEVANGYIVSFRNYLKGQQGQLDLAIDLEALLSEKLAKKEGK